MELSLRAYAAHRKSLGLSGGTLRAVQKAIQSGRIRTKRNGKIDPEEADSLWEEETVNSPKEQIRTEEQAPVAKAPPPDAFRGKGAMIRAARDANRLEIERIMLQQRRGELVSKREVQTEFEGIVHMLKGALQTIPSRVKAQAPEIADEHVLLIERYINQSLSELVRNGLSV